DYASRYGQQVPTVTEAAPYPVSSAFDVEAVPTLYLVGDDGRVKDSVAGWDREGWNRVAQASGGPPVSDEGDGLPVYRPG
ncbi:MAG: hypothetical protein M3203_07315, partial [Actinomycetota bacterium]|nr:hypothetical protein [Actinomycetota bacterium]